MVSDYLSRGRAPLFIIIAHFVKREELNDSLGSEKGGKVVDYP